MEIIASSIFVENQEETLQFYTDILGFEKKEDEPVGEGYRWIALASPNSSNKTQLILEPNGDPIAKDFQTRLFEAGIPITMFGVSDVHKEYEKLSQKGVKFTVAPAKVGKNNMAIFDDTCGNLIQIIDK
ncbi:VOC family protein [Staphylococcus croceilyticus]|uniref:VOC family protein n=1 Tax=Staphylococcus croceilyticus TaxID=319942 RepID=A0ABY2KIR9_9STAP|nr:VOC family protein [Staphylococcus croceilyticus]PNZ67420.1 bleomycin resistance protein [Staphylococcus croceilyticus]TGA80823.1 VOC family protein [Staphylococcus croceilyticus]